MIKQRAGRVLVLRWDGPLDGSGPAPGQVALNARDDDSRFVLLDVTHAPYADSSGLRWLLRLQDELNRTGKCLRIVARRGGKVWRNLKLLNAGMDLFSSVGGAWKTPWQCGPDWLQRKRITG